MIETKLDIPCIWGGILTGILLKNDTDKQERLLQPTTKIIMIHGWLDNLNSMLPLAKKLLDRHPSETFTVICMKSNRFFLIDRL